MTTEHLDETIDSIAELERRAHDNVSTQQRWIERITREVGQPRTLLLVVVGVGVWIAANLMLTGLHRGSFDPFPFALLDTVLSVLQVLMVVLILTTENRIARIDLLRERLDLQMNLLNERRAAKIIAMIDALRRDLPSVPTHFDPEVRTLQEPTDPHAVTRELEVRLPEAPGTS